VVGGYAVNYYGYSRATADLDIWIGITPENAEAAASVVRAFGFSQAQAAAASGNVFIAGLDSADRIYWYSLTGNNWFLAGGAGISSTVLAGGK